MTKASQVAPCWPLSYIFFRGEPGVGRRKGGAIRTCDPSEHNPPMCVWVGGACVHACVRVCLRACVRACVRAGDSEYEGVVFQRVSVSLCFV